MPKTKEELIKDGYSNKQADAIIRARKKRPTTAFEDIKKATQDKNKTMDEIANW